MPSFQAYLQRALRSSDPVLRHPAKAIDHVSRFTDRILGSSSSKLRTQAHAMGHAASMAKGVHPGLASQQQRFADKLSQAAKASTKADNSVRMKTVAGVGSAALIHKALSNQGSSDYGSYSNSYPTYY